MLNNFFRIILWVHLHIGVTSHWECTTELNGGPRRYTQPRIAPRGARPTFEPGPTYRLPATLSTEPRHTQTELHHSSLC
jgi:hypothetical protein